jgi:F-box domain
MSSIPVDVLLKILEHVGKADLVTLCQVNKICSSYSQDILYHEISARSTHTDYGCYCYLHVFVRAD